MDGHGPQHHHQHSPSRDATTGTTDLPCLDCTIEAQEADDKETFDVKKQQVLRKNLMRMNKRFRSVFKFSRSYYAQYMRYRFLKLRWINNCVVNFM